MDLAFLIAVGAVLCLLSGMIALRMGSAGASARLIAATLVELWAVFALWMVAFRGLAANLGPPPTGSAWEELQGLGRRAAALSLPRKLLDGSMVVLSLAVCWHLLRSLRRVMQLAGADGR